MEKIIYLDHAAATAMAEGVLEAMEPYLTGSYGNPMSIYGFGARCRKAVEKARQQTAELIGANPEEIFFTSGGTEANNWAVRSADPKRGRHIVTTAIEHPAVLRSCQAMETQGFRVTRLPVSPEGLVDPSDMEDALRGDTALVSVMAANNEVGTVQPIDRIGAKLRQRGVLFHTDAVQAAGHIPVDVKQWNVDLLSGSGHKFGGPKGVGFLYIRGGEGLEPLLYGGGQERQMRGGTHNVPAIVGMGAAAALAKEQLTQRMAREYQLRGHFTERILKEIPGARLNGDPVRRLPGSCSFLFPCVPGESLLILLDRSGVCASAGSACSSGDLSPSYVLTTMGLTKEEAGSSVRFTLSYRNTIQELDDAVDALKRIVSELRTTSPWYENGEAV